MRLVKLLGTLLLAGMLVAAIGCGKKAEEEPAQQAEPTTEQAPATVADYTPTGEDLGLEVTCPVCGMKFQVTETTPAAVYQDQVYYFCTADEKAQFAADPMKFIGLQPDTTAVPAEEGQTH